MKMIFLILLAAGISAPGWAQTLTPTVLSAGGGSSRSGGISLAWTLGESWVEPLKNTGQFYTQGFHQPILRVKAIRQVTNNEAMPYQVAVAPNPVRAQLTVSFESSTSENVLITVNDLLGRPLASKRGMSTGETQVDMSAYLAGVYLLNVYNIKGQLVRTFKIVKAY